MIKSNSIFIRDKYFSKIEEEYGYDYIEEFLSDFGIKAKLVFGNFGDMSNLEITEESDFSLLEELAKYIDSGSIIKFCDNNSCDAHLAFFNGESFVRYPIINHDEI